MENDTASVRMRSGDHLGDAKMSKKGTSHRRIELFNELQKTEAVFAEQKKKGRSKKLLPQIFFIFALGLSYDLSKFR